MMPSQVYDPRAMLGLRGRGVRLHALWPRRDARAPQPLAAPVVPQRPRPRAHAPTPWEGRPPRPSGAACAPAATPPPPRRPAPLPPPQRCPWARATSRHVGPPTGGDARGGAGWHHRRAPGQPRGRPGRQVDWRSGPGDLVAPPGPLGPGPRLAGELRGRGLACWAAGLGRRAPARGCAVAPNPVQPGLVPAAAPRQALPHDVLCAGPGRREPAAPPPPARVSHRLALGGGQPWSPCATGDWPWRWGRGPWRGPSGWGPTSCACARQIGGLPGAGMASRGIGPPACATGAGGCQRRGARTKARGPSRGGCRGRGYSRRRSSSHPGASAGAGGNPGWGSARVRRSSKSWQRVVGRAIHLL